MSSIAIVAKECPLCQGTGWKVVERGGLSGAARCVCSSTQNWYKFRKRKRSTGFGSTVPEGPWVYCCWAGPMAELLSFARELLDASQVEVENLGLERPRKTSDKPFAHRGTLSFYMEKF